MVTTNIPDSFDPAFERRFLFKQNISLPNQLVREQLLRNHFPKLSSSFIKDLSMNYVFSAAELINFKRQVSIQLLTSNLPENEITEQGIELFLSNGKSKQNRNPIGFKY
jgi:SpoVK/Ycf46/Vps4 family AAA+-type ATPase